MLGNLFQLDLDFIVVARVWIRIGVAVLRPEEIRFQGLKVFQQVGRPPDERQLPQMM